METLQTNNIKAKNYAAIDVGTNSFHLIIANVDSRGLLNIILREKEVVRLGESGSDIKYLSEEAVERGVRVLKRFAEIARSKKATIRAVATSAVREAQNQDEFIRKVKEEAGIDIEIASGFEEGRLIYLGAIHSLPIVNRKAFVIDIGGGSTETIIGYNGKIEYIHSEKLGAIRITKRFGLEDEIDSKKIEEAREYIRGVWAPIFEKINNYPYDILVGTAGTILNLAVISKAIKNEPIPEIINGMVVKKNDLFKAIKKVIKAKSLNERKEIPGIDPNRADIIVGGALILEYALENSRTDSLIISSFALREGILYDTLEKEKEISKLQHLSHLRESSIISIAQKYQVNLVHSNFVRNIASTIFDELREYHMLGVREKEWLEAAAILHDVGYLISVDQHHKHSYYIISHCILPGFTMDEAEIIANIARYHRKSHPKKRHENFARLSPERQEIVKILAGMLRISEGIDRRQIQCVKDIEISKANSHVTIKLIPADPAKPIDVERWGAERRKLLLEEALNITISIA